MSGYRHEDGMPDMLAWEAEIDRLCSGQSGWALAQCLSTLALLRASDLFSTEQGALCRLSPAFWGRFARPKLRLMNWQALPRRALFPRAIVRFLWSA